MLPTKKRCPRCGRVLPAEAFNLVRGGRELAGWCRVCNHRYYLDRKEAGFVRKNPSGLQLERRRCGNGDSGRLFHPSNSLRVGLGTLRPLKARKSLLLGGNGGLTCRGFQHSDRLRVGLGTLRPSKC